MSMASALNETGRSEESIRRNPAVVLGGDSSFFGTDSSAWALPTATLLGAIPEMWPAVLALWKRKLSNDPSSFLPLDSNLSNRDYWLFPLREICEQRLAWFTVRLLPNARFGIGL